MPISNGALLLHVVSIPFDPSYWLIVLGETPLPRLQAHPVFFPFALFVAFFFTHLTNESDLLCRPADF